MDLQQSDINGRGVYFINSGVSNFGIKGKTDRPARIFKPNTITVDFFGNAYYRPFEYKMATHNHVFSLSGDIIQDEDVGLYLVCQMSYLKKLFSFNNMGTWTAIKKLEIKIPVSSQNLIDFAFMRRYIATLKAERLATLKAYLQVAGLADTLLTAQENDAVHRINAKDVVIKPIRMSTIFDIQKGKRLTKQNMKPGNVNFIGAISSNNGIREKIDAPRTWKANCITVNYNGSVGYSFFQEEPFYASDDVNVLYLKERELNRNIALYLCSAIFKFAQKHSYASKWTKEKMLATSILLPVTSKNEIDYSFMETYISAQTKLCIRSLMKAKDMEIETTDCLVNKTHVSQESDIGKN